MLTLNSLRSRLFAWLMIPLAFMSIAHLASTYSDTKKTSEEIFDKLLLTLAISISEHALSSRGDILTDDVLDLIHKTTNDNLYYKVIGPDNAFIVGYEDIPDLPGGIDYISSNVHYYYSHYWGEKVRIISVSSLIDDDDLSGWSTTYVAQTMNDRQAYVRSALFDSAGRLFLLMIVMAGLLYFGVKKGLSPLENISNAVRQRDPKDLSPLPTDKLPKEISVLVTELNSLFAKLFEQMALTKRFVENAAHQLRTPVAALIPQIDLASRKAVTDKEKATFLKIRRSAENIAHLIHQLLNLTHAEAIRKGGIPFTTFNLEKICVKLARQYRQIDPDIQLALDLSPAIIKGVELQLEEALDNLLDNACKYAEGSNITVKTHTENDNAILTVVDQGPGIPEQFRQKVKERFFRVSSSSHGTGLGLAIVEEIIISHKGSLEICSGPDGIGTSFICSFPNAKTPK